MPSSAASLLLLAPLALVKGATLVVNVGQGGADAFSPSSITAAAGDQVEFHFVGGGHIVTQGTFDNPCFASGDNAWNSGYVAKAGVSMNQPYTRYSIADSRKGLPFTITVNSTDPIYYFCPVSGHCQDGMAGAINAP